MGKVLTVVSLIDTRLVLRHETSKMIKLLSDWRETQTNRQPDEENSRERSVVLRLYLDTSEGTSCRYAKV